MTDVVVRTEKFLNDTWQMYFHDPDKDAWDIESYEQLASLSTVEDVVDIHHVLRGHWACGMFFLMREHILPIWEDRHNKEGGCLSYKIMKPDVPEYWFELMCRAVGENVLAKESQGVWEKVCGVSISPKRHFCILRVWVAEQDMRDVERFAITLPGYTTMMYRSYQTGDTDDAT